MLKSEVCLTPVDIAERVGTGTTEVSLALGVMQASGVVRRTVIQAGDGRYVPMYELARG